MNSLRAGGCCSLRRPRIELWHAMTDPCEELVTNASERKDNLEDLRYHSVLISNELV